MHGARRKPRRGAAGWRGRLDRALDLAAAGLLVLFLAVAVPWALGRAGNEVAAAADDGESLDDARARVFGQDYTRAIDAIRRELAPEDAYLMVEGGLPASGGVFWVRHDLAPRRAIYLGRLDELTSSGRARQRIAISANLRQVVVAYDTGVPPRLYQRYQFLAAIDRGAFAPPSTPPSAASTAPAPARPAPRRAGRPGSRAR